MNDNSTNLNSKRPLYVGDELWFYSERRRAQPLDFDHDRNVILLHGFTANGSYMETLAQDIACNGNNIFIYNYNSYRGIKRAAEILAELLTNYDAIQNGTISRKKFSFVCHSMGGLVARAFYQLTECREYVSSIVTLGTPHGGTLYNSRLVEFVIQWGENISKDMPGFHPDCQSARELVGSDNESSVPLLEKMKRDGHQLCEIPMLSISAGKRWLEVGDSYFVNFFANRALQKAFNNMPNDGLVPESSSNLKSALGFHSHKVDHVSDYREYDDLNHTYMIYNQSLSLKIARWLKEKHEIYATEVTQTITL